MPRRALLFALGLGLALFLFLQPGNPYDEAEHLHAAWLMAVRGLHPIRDFFEHHPPLFWQVLALPFRLGMRGPEVLYAARLLVVLCAAVWSWTLFSLARRWSKEPESGGAFAFVLFALTVLLAHQLFVARPETLAAALLGLSLLSWTSSRSLWTAAAAGALCALSGCASPRFLLLAPVLALAGADGRRLLAALAGAAAAFAAFVIWLCPWQDLLFDLRFSALLQRAGLPPAIFSLVYLASSLAAAALVFGMVIATRQVPVRRAALWAAHGAGVWAVCIVGSGQFLFAQAFAPALLWATLFTAWLEAQPADERSAAARPALLLGSLAASLAALVVQTAAASLNTYNVPSLTASRRMLLDALPGGSRVLLLPENHPITADDASYFGALLSSSICDAAAAYPAAHPQSTIQLPRCDFVSDLRRGRPAAVSRDLFRASPPLQIEELGRELAAHYQLTDTLDDAPVRDFSANTLFRTR